MAPPPGPRLGLPLPYGAARTDAKAIFIFNSCTCLLDKILALGGLLLFVCFLFHQELGYGFISRSDQPIGPCCVYIYIYSFIHLLGGLSKAVLVFVFQVHT